MKMNLKTLLLCFWTIGFCGIAIAQSDTPCNAPLMPVSPDSCHYALGTTVGALYQNDAANGGTPPCASPGAADVWYRFVVPPGGAVAITMLQGTIIDGGMALYSGPCSALQLVQCEDDNGVGMMPVIDRSDLTPGDTMYIRVWQGWNPNGTGTFRICFVESNSDCGVAIPLCAERYYYTHAYGPGSNLDATGSQCDIYEYQSQWFKWKILTAGTLSFTIYPDSISPANWPDWDWLLYQTMDSIFCTNFVGGNQPYACNGSSSYGPFGATGLDVTGTSNSVPAGPGNPYCPIINANVGEYYYLMINNFSISSTGFRIHLGGTATLDCDIVNPPTAVAAGLPAARVMVAPNPAGNWVTITLRGVAHEAQPHLRVVDIHGKCIAHDALFSDGAFQLNLQDWTSGMYFFEAWSDEGTLGRGKFLKQ